jgi:16S rRNA (guanine966-N2)-methyltransferase
LRVVGGALSGRKIASPPGMTTRPTLDRVRESLFNILARRVEGARVLDLYAGTGALSIEALSRGAAHAHLVERDARALHVLRGNLQRLAVSDRTTVWAATAEVAVRRLVGQRFDLIFLDPPWNPGPGPSVWRAAGELLEDDGLAVLECPDLGRALPPQQGGMVEVGRRRYGRTHLIWLAPAR